jgi:toxin ParE1/3/4
VDWTVRLSAAAEKDFEEIVDWTAARFGARQAEIYAAILTSAIQELHSGPDLPGAKARNEIGKGICTLHAARRGRRARHFVLSRVGHNQEKVIDVIRILHDSMEFPRHLPAED